MPRREKLLQRGARFFPAASRANFGSLFSLVFFTQDRINKLNELGFVWNQLEAQWQLMLAQLAKYKEDHGDCLVPRGYGRGKPKLGSWVNTQRSQYSKWRRGKDSQITQGRINKLNELGFVWNKYEAQWQLMWGQLAEFKGKHGHSKVPVKNKELYVWGHTQRHERRKLQLRKRSTMTEDRINQLDELTRMTCLRTPSKC